jgi:tetratricopeptide (TPR) repeat protein
MNSPRTIFLLLVALLVSCFGLAAHLQPQFQAWRGSRASGDIFNVVLGDSRRMFAQSFYVKADEYYHSGYYPTIFDNNEAFKTAHMAEDTGAVNSRNHGDETGFLGPRRNWIDAFGRHFFPDRHTHLDEGGPTDDLSGSDNVREILPWLKLSADLDPDNVQTYTVTAYWLRSRMHKVAEAEAVLHEGLRNCPDSYDILFELGRLYDEDYHDTGRARNVWELAIRKWLKIYPALDPEAQKDNRLIFEQITTHLAKLEEDAGNLPEALNWYKAAQKISATPDALQSRIDAVQKKLHAPILVAPAKL